MEERTRQPIVDYSGGPGSDVDPTSRKLGAAAWAGAVGGVLGLVVSTKLFWPFAEFLAQGRSIYHVAPKFDFPPSIIEVWFPFGALLGLAGALICGGARLAGSPAASRFWIRATALACCFGLGVILGIGLAWHWWNPPLSQPVSIRDVPVIRPAAYGCLATFVDLVLILVTEQRFSTNADVRPATRAR